ncbi:hypothetical protein [Azohydromonas lata]|uniref:Uncharacterized protein n=1 Tax=Azohydromonas lata TaxID=45677 RepID=A0ABU5IKE5_9BURK|nr:hypothetical protein [Azohydromonas lata]MDZ5459355.1 hypothetical protein [Azohydromonas lata]
MTDNAGHRAGVFHGKPGLPSRKSIEKASKTPSCFKLHAARPKKAWMR